MAIRVPACDLLDSSVAAPSNRSDGPEDSDQSRHPSGDLVRPGGTDAAIPHHRQPLERVSSGLDRGHDRGGHDAPRGLTQLRPIGWRDGRAERSTLGHARLLGVASARRLCGRNRRWSPCGRVKRLPRRYPQDQFGNSHTRNAVPRRGYCTRADEWPSRLLHARRLRVCREGICRGRADARDHHAVDRACDDLRRAPDPARALCASDG